MPYDALVVRALEKIWRRELIGCRFDSGFQTRGKIYLTGRARGRDVTLLMAFQPGMARMHRTTHSVKPNPKTLSPFLQRLLPFTITGLEVPPFERVISLDILKSDDWGEPVVSSLVVELAGHLTNLVWNTAQGIVIDALRRVSADQPGRTVWPGIAYSLPPALPNVCHTKNPSHLPPLARGLAEEGSQDDFFQNFCRDWEQADYTPYRLTQWDKGTLIKEEAWIYPLPGWQSEKAENLEELLDAVFQRKEEAALLRQMAMELLRLTQDRHAHLRQKLHEYTEQIQTDPEGYKEQADLWLSYQHLFRNPELREITVPALHEPDQSVCLALDEGESAKSMAEKFYKRYKKQKQRLRSLEQLIPALRQELDEVQSLLKSLDEPHDKAWYQQRLTARQAKLPAAKGPTEFRRFVSTSGYPIWVGKNRDENHRLTFQKARPDDLWFHTKQSPGSHVILLCGKKNPNLEDLLDAANLAVFFSTASQSSSVPVDYTRRKFVRKRPHAEPGQVLYQRERTLYITPDSARLKRMGAVSEKLVED